MQKTEIHFKKSFQIIFIFKNLRKCSKLIEVSFLAHPDWMLFFRRDKFNFLLKQSMYADAILHAEKMITLFQAFGSDNSMVKTMLGVTVLNLALGDTVKAEQKHLQEHFNVATYLSSKFYEQF